MTDEKYLIGQILWEPSIYNKVGLTADDFLGSQEAAIFTAMGVVDVIDELSLHKATGISLVSLLGYKDSNIITSSWESVQRRIIEDSRKRKIQRAAEEIYRGNMTADAMIDIFAEATQSVRRNATFKIESLSDCVLEVVKDIEERAKNGGMQGLSTGFRKLDSMFGGLQKGKLYIIAARPSQGKSALLMNMAVNQKSPVTFITAESNKVELTKRMMSYKSRVLNTHINNGTLTQENARRVVETASNLSERKDFKIYDESNLTLGRLLSICHDAKQYHKAEAIFIDYIQIIKHPNDRLPKHEQVAEISKMLKQIARDLNVPVIAASQLRRDAEGKKPQLSDFSDSTQLERDADVAMAIYNVPDKKTKAVVVGQDTYICILKNRDGALGDIAFEGHMQYYSFQERLDEGTKQMAESQDTLYF